MRCAPVWAASNNAAAAAAGSARVLLGFSPSSFSASLSPSLPRARPRELAFESAKRGMMIAPRRGMASYVPINGSTGELATPRKVNFHSLHARRFGVEFPERAPHGGLLLLPLSSLPRRVPGVTGSAAALHAGINTKDRIESALTDFILDGSKTTSIAHKVWQGIVRAGDTVIDATCGNGHDTLMLAKLVLQDGTAGCVIGLDLQQCALDNTASLLNRELNSSQRDKVNLLQLCHSQLDKVVDENSVRLVAFNLGYQPGGDKSFITHADTTVKAVGAAVNVLEQQGLISIMSYVGHPGGREEYEAVREFAASLPADEWVCSHIEWINRPLCPHLMFLLRK